MLGGLVVGLGYLSGALTVNDNSSFGQTVIQNVTGPNNLNRIGTGTKSGALSGSFTESDSLDDSAPLTGPSLSLPVKGDVTEWQVLSWLPSHTRMELYGHAYFGDAEMASTSFDMTIYGVGVRTIVPLVGEPSSTFQAGGTVSLGVGYMDTDVGSTTGFEPAAGLQASIVITGNLSFNVNADYYLFVTDGAVYEGPALTGGLTLGF